MVRRMPSLLGLAGLLLFGLIFVVLVVGDALANVLEEVLSKLLGLTGWGPPNKNKCYFQSSLAPRLFCVLKKLLSGG